MIFEAHQGYTASIPIHEARKDPVILVHTFSNERLSESHGAPLRGLVPDRCFYKSAKWIHGIKFSTKDKLGYRGSNGFSTRLNRCTTVWSVEFGSRCPLNGQGRICLENQFFTIHLYIGNIWSTARIIAVFTIISEIKLDIDIKTVSGSGTHNDWPQPVLIDFHLKEDL